VTAGSSVSKQRKFFFDSAIQQLDIETLHPYDVSGEGKNEKERGVVVTEALSLYPNVGFGDSEVCHVDRITV